jgi:pimeloyl-ACP methyl ester carboxylesterase
MIQDGTVSSRRGGIFMDHRAKIDVGGYQLAFQSFGSRNPTVVFESGGECGAEAFANLAQQVQSFTRALIYDRAGLGQSAPAPRPRTVQDAAADLHTLLHTAQIPGPYLLVGHSFGGLIVRLYADQFPDEVAGMVLLDVPHPEQSLRELQILPAPSPHEPVAVTASRAMLSTEWSDPFSNCEGMDRAASAAQVRATGHLGQLPLVVITAGKDEWEEGFPPEIARAMEHDWMAMQQELAALSHNNTHIIATESTHDIQDCQPDLVIDVIRQLIGQLRE